MSHDEFGIITIIRAIPGGFSELVFGRGFDDIPETREFCSDWVIRNRSIFSGGMDARDDEVLLKEDDSMKREPQVHDLILTPSESALFSSLERPAWLPSAISRFPWVVVRRGTAKEGAIPIGARGQERHERWAGYIQASDALAVKRPDELRFQLVHDSRCKLPAFQTLAYLETHLTGLDLNWGPGGSVGYELASGMPAVTDHSDLDLVLFAPDRLNQARARDLSSLISSAPGRVDVLVETSHCGFSLQEFITTAPDKILLRTPNGRLLGSDPWAVSGKEAR